jgi:hypothetical protein
MKSKVLWMFIAVSVFIANTAICADEKKDLATGEGIMIRDGENVIFEPRYGYAYSQTTGAKKQVWLLMSDEDPKSIDWTAAKDRTESLRLWCKAKEAGFVLVELDGEGAPQLVTQCPANGAIAIEMISVMNDLPSVQMFYEINDGKRIRGRMLGGVGSCGDKQYCEKTKEYYFDVTLSN